LKIVGGLWSGGADGWGGDERFGRGLKESSTLIMLRMSSHKLEWKWTSAEQSNASQRIVRGKKRGRKERAKLGEGGGEGKKGGAFSGIATGVH